MIDLYGLGSSGIPLEYSAQLRALQQQQMIANSLLQQSQDPVQNSGQPGSAISPFQGLAKVAQAYVGAKAMQNANNGYQGIGEKYNADQNAAIQKVIGSLAPRTLPDSLPGAPATMPRTIEEQRAALVEPSMSQYPNVRNFATSQNALINQRENREDLQAHQAQLLDEKRKDREMEIVKALEAKKEMQQQAFENQKILKSMGGSGQAQPFFQFLPGADGYMVGNARTGQITPGMVNGQPAIKASDSPVLQGQIAGAKKGAQERAESQVKAEVGLPQAIANAGLASKQIDDLLAHPGFSSTVGATLRPGARLIDGTPEADFSKRLDQLQGGAFLQAFEALKGGGQITEIEGKKATEALTRMSKSQSEKEFVNAAREYQGYIKTGVERARQKAGGAAPKAVSVESLLEKYK